MFTPATKPPLMVKAAYPSLNCVKSVPGFPVLLPLSNISRPLLSESSRPLLRPWRD